MLRNFTSWQGTEVTCFHCYSRKGKGKHIYILAIIAMVTCILSYTLPYSFAADYLISRGRKIAAIFNCFFVFSVLYLLILLIRRPAVLFQTELFSPYRYTMNAIIPRSGILWL